MHRLLKFVLRLGLWISSLCPVHFTSAGSQISVFSVLLTVCSGGRRALPWVSLGGRVELKYILVLAEPEPEGCIYITRM